MRGGELHEDDGIDRRGRKLGSFRARADADRAGCIRRTQAARPGGGKIRAQRIEHRDEVADREGISALRREAEMRCRCLDLGDRLKREHPIGRGISARLDELAREQMRCGTDAALGDEARRLGAGMRGRPLALQEREDLARCERAVAPQALVDRPRGILGNARDGREEEVGEGARRPPIHRRELARRERVPCTVRFDEIGDATGEGDERSARRGDAQRALLGSLDGESAGGEARCERIPRRTRIGRADDDILRALGCEARGLAHDELGLREGTRCDGAADGSRDDGTGDALLAGTEDGMREDGELAGARGCRAGARQALGDDAAR